MGASVQVGRATLSEQERVFVDTYVANGGKGEEAALAAGYSASNPSVAASRLLVRSRVLAEVRRLSLCTLDAGLPIAIGALIEIAGDQDAPLKERIKAAGELLDRAKVQGTHGAGVQVNVQVNGREAQTMIGSVWEARAARVSTIDSTMLDTEADAAAPPIGQAPAAPTGQGGGRDPGSPPAVLANTSLPTVPLPNLETLALDLVRLPAAPVARPASSVDMFADD